MTPTLADLRQTLQTWKGIELAEKSNPVPGDGNPTAEIMFVGEAPGQKEDEQGRPFVGQAGKLLDELLASINLKREDVYITNVVKFRPPENRDPTPEEKDACMPFLKLEIALIKPAVIVPLGKHALGTFFTNLNISTAHGKPQVLNQEIAIFPLYHPAAALHNPNLRQTLFDDIKALRSFLDHREAVKRAAAAPKPKPKQKKPERRRYDDE